MTGMSRRMYSYAFLLPAGVIYGVLFLLPTLMSFFFSMTRWTLLDWNFIGLENFVQFFEEGSLSIGFRNTFVYAVLTCGFKVLLGLVIGTLLCTGIRSRDFLRSVIYFPNLLSTIAVGVTFGSMMHPTTGLINVALSRIGIVGPDWLGDTHIALLSVVGVDVWKGVGMATVIYIAGIMSIPGSITKRSASMAATPGRSFGTSRCHCAGRR